MTYRLQIIMSDAQKDRLQRVCEAAGGISLSAYGLLALSRQLARDDKPARPRSKDALTEKVKQWLVMDRESVKLQPAFVLLPLSKKKAFWHLYDQQHGKMPGSA